ncbi:hypothetical protein DPMN_005876 [Dreissena polymorpha]|uniref:Uncharacterized protein n=1 Tax=Dreissena polymorpha TaxID=45954 RepID=A0A9D4MT30_DREPO|nr:hypothetical protein DPMN_005876 [Dreissena polymorpha]
MLKLAQTDRPTDQQTNGPTDQQTGQKQYVPHYYSGGHKQGHAPIVKAGQRIQLCNKISAKGSNPSAKADKWTEPCYKS